MIAELTNLPELLQGYIVGMLFTAFIIGVLELTNGQSDGLASRRQWIMLAAIFFWPLFLMIWLGMMFSALLNGVAWICRRIRNRIKWGEWI